MYILFIGFLIVQSLSSCNFWTSDSAAANTKSKNLFDAVNAKRVELGKAALPYSPSLTFVAQLRVDDSYRLYHDNVDGSSYSSHWGSSCCPYYSWSREGPWGGVCYPTTSPSQSDSDFIYGIARNITDYNNDVRTTPTARSTGAYPTAADCVTYWVGSSRGDKLWNINSYSNTYYDWKAMGCAYTDNRCECYVGLYEDPVDDDCPEGKTSSYAPCNTDDSSCIENVIDCFPGTHSCTDIPQPDDDDDSSNSIVVGICTLLFATVFFLLM